MNLFVSFQQPASMWLRVHEQVAPDVHGHEYQRRSQQQVLGLHHEREY